VTASLASSLDNLPDSAGAAEPAHATTYDAKQCLVEAVALTLVVQASISED